MVIPLIWLRESLSGLNIPTAVYEQISNKYGIDASKRVQEWERLLEGNTNASKDEKLASINLFFNEFTFIDDKVHWGKTDYWATPIEFIASGGGDCEDFTIAKYFSLRSLGVPERQLRFMYVKAVRLNQAHMVLAYFPKPDSIPLLLDNLHPKILPADQRKDLSPVYSFNGAGLWLAKAQGTGTLLKDKPNHKQWQDLLKRMEE